MQKVRPVLAIALQGVAMAMAAVSSALMILDLDSTAVITLAVGLFALAIAPRFASEA